VELFGLLCFGICFSVVVHHLATILETYLETTFQLAPSTGKLPNLCELRECSMIIVAIALLSLSLSLSSLTFLRI
jgi:hypothetical protein